MADNPYDVNHMSNGEVSSMVCKTCGFSLIPRKFHRAGDRSGIGRYNRARAVMISHIHETHPEVWAAYQDQLRSEREARGGVSIAEGGRQLRWE
jgi:hypothetical protein